MSEHIERLFVIYIFIIPFLISMDIHRFYIVELKPSLSENDVEEHVTEGYISLNFEIFQPWKLKICGPRLYDL